MSKISAYGALARASLQPGDLLPVVDVSDFSMAGSGTTKQITAGDLLAGAALTPLASPQTASLNPVAAGVFYQCDTTAGAITLTLPHPAADKVQVGFKLIASSATVSPVTISCASGDCFNAAGGATTVTLSTLWQGMVVQYDAALGIWYIVGDDLSLAQMDARYAPLRIFSPLNYGAYGDGIHDDTAALQACIAAACYLGTPTCNYMSIVDLGNYTFLTSSPLNLPYGIHLRGSGTSQHYLSAGQPGGTLCPGGTIVNSTSDIFQMPAGSYALIIENCTFLATGTWTTPGPGTGGHVFHPLQNCSLNSGVFHHVYAVQNNPAYGIWYAVGGSHINMTFDEACFFQCASARLDSGCLISSTSSPYTVNDAAITANDVGVPVIDMGGVCIPNGTTVATADPVGGTFTLSQAPVGTGSGLKLSVGGAQVSPFSFLRTTAFNSMRFSNMTVAGGYSSAVPFFLVNMQYGTRRTDTITFDSGYHYWVGDAAATSADIGMYVYDPSNFPGSTGGSLITGITNTPSLGYVVQTAATSFANPPAGTAHIGFNGWGQEVFFDNIVFELCMGGAIWLYGVLDAGIDDCAFWDVTATNNIYQFMEHATNGTLDGYACCQVTVRRGKGGVTTPGYYTVYADAYTQGLLVDTLTGNWGTPPTISGPAMQTTIINQQTGNRSSQIPATFPLVTGTRIQKRVNTLTVSGSTYTPVSDTTDIAIISGPAAPFTIATPTHSYTATAPADGDMLIIRIVSTTSYGITWGSTYSGSVALPLPTSATANTTDSLGFQWNAAEGHWVLLAYTPGT